MPTHQPAQFFFTPNPQFGVYEFMKRSISSLPERPALVAAPKRAARSPAKAKKGKKQSKQQQLEEGSEFSGPPLSELLDEIEDQV